MSDLQRLLADEASDFERQLLRSWETEQPSDEARARVVAVLGIGAGAAAVTATAAKIGATASVAPKAAAAVGSAVIAKWAAVVLGAAALGVTIGYVRHASHSSKGAVIAAAPTDSALPVPPPVTAAPPPPMAPSAKGIPSESRAAPIHRSVEVHAKRPPRDPSTLADQVSAIDSARGALAAGDTPSAIRDLDDYEAKFPSGALIEEAETLRVQALLDEGDRASASRVGERFLSAHPNSPHAARVRALLAAP